MEVKVVLGLNFGDEGKGMVVQNLCQQALLENKKPLVVRFSGGPQAAHTIINNDIVHICSTYGSGSLLNIPTVYLGNHYCIDPICFIGEKQVLNNCFCNPEIWFDKNIKIITPYDVMFSQTDPTNLSNGTCGRGVYATILRYQTNPLFQKLSITNRQEILIYLEHVKQYYKQCYFLEYKIDDCIVDRFCNDTLKVYHRIKDIDTKYLEYYDTLILEGSQGLLLDPDYSPYFPHVTATSLVTIPEILLNYNLSYYFVTRTYLTRHGNGFTPDKNKDFYNLKNKFEINQWNKFQGNFKTGILSFDLINRAIHNCKLNDITNKNLVITHMDIPYDNNKFYFKYLGEMFSFSNMNIEVSPYEICQCFLQCINTKFNNIYYTNSPKSQLHRIIIRE